MRRRGENTEAIARQIECTYAEVNIQLEQVGKIINRVIKRRREVI